MGDNLQSKIVLGVDIGTTNIRCYAYNHYGQVLGGAQEKITVQDTNDGRHEIKPDLLWNAFESVVKNCIIVSNMKAEEVAGLGISTQRGSFLTWDRHTSESFHNFITWKDRRAETSCNDWNSSMFTKFIRFGAKMLYCITRKKIFQVASVLRFTSSMVLSRLHWILKHNKKVQQKVSQKEALFGTIDTWIIWKLTGGKVHATDSSNACVTGFFDPFKMQWMSLMLKTFNIPEDILPVVKNTCDSFGNALPEIFGYSFPICSVVGDQQAAMFGAGCFKKSDMNFTMGTGTFVKMNTGATPAASFQGVYPLVGWTISSKTTYIIECCVHDAGTAFSLAQKLGLLEQASESSEIAKSVSGSGGICFLPSATLLETGGKRSMNTTSVTGLNLHSSKAQLVRAILEALSFQIRYLFDVIRHNYNAEHAQHLRINGGIAQNDFILQQIANLLKRPVTRSVHVECSSLGAAFLAGIQCGMWKSLDEIPVNQMEWDTFFPDLFASEECISSFINWRKAVCHPILTAQT